MDKKGNIFLGIHSVLNHQQSSPHQNSRGGGGGGSGGGGANSRFQFMHDYLKNGESGQVSARGIGSKKKSFMGEMADD